MTITYTPSNVCAKAINFSVEDNKVADINIVGGCPGNLIGLSHLVTGMEVEDVITKLEGITCGHKNTSCPDQLSKALQNYLTTQK